MSARPSAILLAAALPRPSVAQNVLLVVAGSLLAAACAQVAVPLPFSPVPVTGQTFAVLLLGATLGPRRAAAALALYLVEGAAGLPVFAPGAAAGAARFAGPTGGYLLAFPLAAFVFGTLLERMPRHWWACLGAAFVADALLLALGAAWLAALSPAPLGFADAVRLGVLPFLPGELVKALLVAAALPASWWAVERARAR
jgi:biotin transport system substrate-specific component